MLTAKNVWLLLLAASIIIFVLYGSRYHGQRRKYLPPDEDVSGADNVYKSNKEILYKPLEGCEKQEFLTSYNNPCWISPEINVTCSARVLLLGFHKSGTTDLSDWFYRHSEVFATNADFFYDKTKLTQLCPLKWLESFGNGYSSTQLNKTSYCDCPGCILISKIIQQNSTHVIRQSAIQYLAYTTIESSRYIITMREPADRMISEFFYTHKEQRPDNPYRRYSVQEVGNSFFHKLVSETIDSLTSCLQMNGTTSCVLANSVTIKVHPHPYVANAILPSCYVPFIREVLRYIPKEKIYFCKLEEYSVDEQKQMKKIFMFVGLSGNSVEKIVSSDLVEGKQNAGYEYKPVFPETKQLLKKFYEPFNVELWKLLNDDKWLWL